MFSFDPIALVPKKLIEHIKRKWAIYNIVLVDCIKSAGSVL